MSKDSLFSGNTFSRLYFYPYLTVYKLSNAQKDNFSNISQMVQGRDEMQTLIPGKGAVVIL